MIIRKNSLAVIGNADNIPVLCGCTGNLKVADVRQIHHFVLRFYLIINNNKSKPLYLYAQWIKVSQNKSAPWLVKKIERCVFNRTEARCVFLLFLRPWCIFYFLKWRRRKRVHHRIRQYPLISFPLLYSNHWHERQRHWFSQSLHIPTLVFRIVPSF